MRSDLTSSSPGLGPTGGYCPVGVTRTAHYGGFSMVYVWGRIREKEEVECLKTWSESQT